MESIRFEKLSFTYPHAEQPALREVSFSVKAGEFCLLIGKSGAGKSTLLKLMKQEIAPFGDQKGTVTVNGTVGYVSQHAEEMMVTDRVYSELAFAPTHAGYSAAQTALAVAETAAYFHLEEQLEREISTLSGGEKQMLALASVMVMQPDILLLDEPIAQLDPVSAGQLTAMIERLHRDFETTIVLSAHRIEDFSRTATDLIVLEDGALTVKAPFASAALQLKEAHSEMAGALPVPMRLYDGASTIRECRAVLQTKTLTVLPKEHLPQAVALTAKHLYAAYEKGNDVLSSLNMNVYQNKVNAVLGANGSGKTTLLKVLAGMRKPYRGTVKASGSVAMLVQNVYDLFTEDTCGAEVTFSEVTALLGIDHIQNRHPYDLSGGEAQRLALAKVLQTGADILLLDEPTKGLDCVLKAQLAALLKQLCDAGKTVLLVTHDIEFAGAYCDVVSFLSGGRLVACDARRDFFSSLRFYTTAVAKISDGRAVSVTDLEACGGLR